MTKKVYILEESTWDYHDNVCVFDRKPTRLKLQRAIEQRLQIKIPLSEIRVDEHSVYDGAHFSYYLVTYDVVR